MFLQSLKDEFPGLRENEPLKNHCTLRVGGPADLFYELENIEELPELVKLAENNNLPYRIIGRGTNILFTDKGFRGLIIKNVTDEIEIRGDEILADSGALLIQVIRTAMDAGLTGLELLHGVPGTIGGAVYGNAGIPNLEIGNFVKYVVVFNACDGVREVLGENISFKYRSSSLSEKREIVMRVALKLQKGGETAKSKELISKMAEIRRGKQPSGWSAGSFFKNPSKEKSAGYLIEQVGLKGFRLGDAQISEKHGNFFINTGQATAKNILELAEMAKKKVKAKFGIILEMEVKVVGDL